MRCLTSCELLKLLCGDRDQLCCHRDPVRILQDRTGGANTWAQNRGGSAALRQGVHRVPRGCRNKDPNTVGLKTAETCYPPPEV